MRIDRLALALAFAFVSSGLAVVGCGSSDDGFNGGESPDTGHVGDAHQDAADAGHDTSFDVPGDVGGEL